MDFRMTSRAESDRQIQHRLARFPIMHYRMRVSSTVLWLRRQ
ncbi:hypothetical protein HDF16_006081 [Granulicella aggregans]|uniref:Uncharacterized protein n=1 Tax=Granulicella aggregans TaxID=474949 RepID=A0A7W7ZK18_9BACT|nr:hypothetical protein [Granulicella aggregans]